MLIIRTWLVCCFCVCVDDHPLSWLLCFFNYNNDSMWQNFEYGTFFFYIYVKTSKLTSEKRNQPSSVYIKCNIQPNCNHRHVEHKAKCWSKQAHSWWCAVDIRKSETRELHMHIAFYWQESCVSCLHSRATRNLFLSICPMSILRRWKPSLWCTHFLSSLGMKPNTRTACV